VRVEQTPPKLNEHHRAVLAELVEAHNDATLSELRDLLRERTEVSVGITTLHTTLEKMELTLKKTFYPDVKASERVQKARVSYRETVLLRLKTWSSLTSQA